MACSQYSAGQALVESLIGLGAMAVLFLLLAGVHRVQDLGLRASHASRYLALALTRRDATEQLEREALERYFDPRSHRWVTRHGVSMVDDDARNVQVQVSAGDALPELQVGAGHPEAGVLRNELLFQDKGISTGRIEVAPRLAPGEPDAAEHQDMLGLRAWDSLQLKVPRHTSILTEAGHAADDSAVSARIAASGHAWKSAASRSEQAGRRAASSLRGLDAPWDRAEPDFDWLRAWEDIVPADRLDSGRNSP